MPSLNPSLSPSYSALSLESSHCKDSPKAVDVPLDVKLETLLAKICQHVDDAFKKYEQSLNSGCDSWRIGKQVTFGGERQGAEQHAPKVGDKDVLPKRPASVQSKRYSERYDQYISEASASNHLFFVLGAPSSRPSFGAPPSSGPSFASHAGEKRVETHKENMEVQKVGDGLETHKESDIHGSCSTNAHSFHKVEEQKRVDAYSFGIGQLKTVSICSANDSGLTFIKHANLCVTRIVEGRLFSSVVAVAIIINAIIIGIEIDLRGRHGEEADVSIFKVCSWFFTMLFLFELILRLLAYGASFFSTHDFGERCWNMFDVVVVLASLFSLISDELENTADLPKLRSVSTFRFFHIMRVLRVLRLLGVCEELRVLILAIGEAIRQSLWMFGLLIVMVYVTGILLAQLSIDAIQSTGASDDHAHDALWRFFGTLPRAMGTLFQSVTGGIDWGDLADNLSIAGWPGVFILNLYIAITVIVLLNVMTGLFCECAIAAALKDQDEVIKQKRKVKDAHIAKLRKLFRELDDRGADSPPGMFTLNELEEFLLDPHIESCFASLEIEPEDAWTLFKLIDTQEKGFIDFDHFLAGCMKCRGVARAMDTHLLRYEVQWVMDHLLFMSKRLAWLELEFSPSKKITEL